MGYEQRTGGTHAWRLLRAKALKQLPLICVACKRELDPTARRCTPTAPELDHILPAAAGGTDTLDNVQWMCHPCNRRKSDRRPGAVPKAGAVYDHRTYDVHGVPILDPRVVCKIHSPILASCPHSGSLK